jgi:hypothetical protein
MNAIQGFSGFQTILRNVKIGYAPKFLIWGPWVRIPSGAPMFSRALVDVLVLAFAALPRAAPKTRSGRIARPLEWRACRQVWLHRIRHR